MNRYLVLLLLIVTVSMACRKRNGKFQFAGVWIIQKVEQVKYIDDKQTLDSTLKSDTLGWFAFNKTLVEGYDLAQFEIKFSSFSGLTSDDEGKWETDEHEGDRLLINGKAYTRERIVGGEKWSWMASQNSGATYTRETLFVKKK